MEFYRSQIPANEQLIRQKAGTEEDFESILNNEAKLNELNDAENEIRRDQGGEKSHKTRGTFSLQDLQAELQEDIEAAIKENFEVFDRKFNLRITNLQDQLSKSTQEILAVVKGPYEKIKNMVRFPTVEFVSFN